MRRAPSEIQSLFQAGLIGEKVAARLGPHQAGSGQLADDLSTKIEEATLVAARLAADAGPLETPRQKLEVQKKINREVLRVLGGPTAAAQAQNRARPLTHAWATASKLGAEDLEELVFRCLKRLPSERVRRLLQQVTASESQAGAA